MANPFKLHSEYKPAGDPAPKSDVVESDYFCCLRGCTYLSSSDVSAYSTVKDITFGAWASPAQKNSVAGEVCFDCFGRIIVNNVYNPGAYPALKTLFFVPGQANLPTHIYG